MGKNTGDQPGVSVFLEFMSLCASGVSLIDPLMAVYIISREIIYNLNWGVDNCREQAAEVSDLA